MLRREPRTKREIYMDYLIYGGDMRALPEPSTAEDIMLYDMCIKGVGTPQRVEGYYKCVINSTGTAQNFFGGFYDLGDYRISSVKVKVRFKVNQGDGLPSKIDMRLFASNSSARNYIDLTNEYFGLDSTQITGVQATEYTMERTFSTANKQLNEFRYLKPFIGLHKTTPDVAPNYNTAHSVDVYEILLEIDGRIIDITDTIRDLDGKAKSNIKYVNGSEYSLDGVRLRKLPWFNKTVVCLGDSITHGLPNGAGSGRLGDPWVTQLQNLCGFSNSRNNGISSSTVAEKSTDVTNWDRDRNPMTKRVAGLDANADVVIFMGGVNDHTQNIQIGDLDPATNKNKDTYFGALNVLFTDLKAKYQNKLIVSMTPMDYVHAPFVDGKNTNGDTVADFRNAMKVACEHHKIHLLDLHEKVGFNANNPDDVTKYFGTGTDKLHPNQVGHDQMAKVIAEELNSLA